MAFGLPYEACVIGMALITCIYVVLGGYMATVVNDFLQGIVMLFGITAVICAVLAGNGGFSQAVIDLSHVQAETNPDLQGAFVSMFGPDPLNLLGVVILTSWAPGACRRWCRSSMPSAADPPSSRAP